MPRRHRPKPHYIINLIISLIGLGLFSMAGLRAASTTSAATANPYGSIDYCTLENNTTVIYGWAADPDATALSQPAVQLSIGQNTSTALTNQANYRDSAVAKWIDTNRRGDPKPGTYGFRLAIPGLFKGTKYPVSGTVLNEGNGSNTILAVNNSSPIDGVDGGTQQNFFADNVLPDACLADHAATATAHVSSAASLPGPQKTSSDETGSSVMAGTMAAEVHVQTAGAASVRIIYGADPLKLDQSSSDMPVSSAETVINLRGLEAATSYSYRVIRTDKSGKKTASPLSNFETLGYVVAIHFVDSRESGIAGITASLSNPDKSAAKSKTSDDNGTVQFTDVSGGDHSLSYSYLGQEYAKSLTVDASSLPPSETAAAQVLTLDQSINIQAAAPVAKLTPGSGGDSGTALTVGIIVTGILAVASFLVWQNVRRRREFDEMLDTPPPPLPEYRPLSPQQPPLVPVPPGADHMGQSLKQLVVHDSHDHTSGPYISPPRR